MKKVIMTSLALSIFASTSALAQTTDLNNIYSAIESEADKARL